MTLSSTEILIVFRTNSLFQTCVPCQLRRDFSPQRLYSVVVWFCALLMTGEWVVDRTGEAFVNGLFVVVMLTIFVCIGIAFIEGVCVGSNTRQR